MATLSLRLRDDLKQKAQQLAKEQGVSLNGFVSATIAAAVAQQETLTFFGDRLKSLDQAALHNRVLKFMRKTRPGKEPSIEEIERAVRG
ncbi:MAG: toxin-antitoxin system HicB family antitoxin [Planctomycetes bacterium]|nr:toxin-antitoxin system HicB family antitoxin [Planctomycetota bacterium]